MVDVKSEYKKKLRELAEIKDALAGIEADVRRLLRKSIELDFEEKFEARREAILLTPYGLNLEAVRDYLCEQNNASSIDLDTAHIGIQGHGPWDVNRFNTFLMDRNFVTSDILEPNAQYLILGSMNVSLEELEEKIEHSIDEGYELRVYTQELFLAWLITGKDPLEEWAVEDLLTSVESHHPIQFLINHEAFSWPVICDAPHDGQHGVKSFEWSGQLSEESPLKKIGYTARDGALTASERRRLLTTAYSTGSIDKFLLNPEDVERWGRARTAQRLYAISSLIAWLANFQGATKPHALEIWRSDLDWLKREFYEARMKFKWPHNIQSSRSKSSRPNSASKLKAPSANKTILNPAASWPFPTNGRP